MNNEFLRQLSPDDQATSEILQANAHSIQVNPSFMSSLEERLKQAHPANKSTRQGAQFKLLPALGWALLAIGAFLVLNWAVRSLVPNRQPAANGTPGPEMPFEDGVKSGNICTGQLAAAHGFTVFLSNPQKTGFIELDKGKNIGELRSFAWSQDGGQLAIVGNTRGSGNLYLTGSANAALQQVLANSELGYLMGTGWSRDGNQLLTWEIENNSKFYTVNRDGTGLAEKDLPVRFSETPQFAPDGESVLFFGTDEFSSGLFQVGLDDLQVSLVSGQLEDASSFAWSPDGARLAYIEMDREQGEARLVIKGQGAKATIATLPIPKGSGSSIPDSGNLSWSPDGKSLVFEFGRYAADQVIYLANADGTGLVALVESAHSPAISADGRCLAFIRNKQVFLLDLVTAASSSAHVPPVLLADLPDGRGIADTQLDKLQWGAESSPIRDRTITENPTPTPTSPEYDWNGTKLYLNAPLPSSPSESSLYLVQAEQHVTLESVRALAAQFGMAGRVYITPPEVPGNAENDFLVVDGNQRLQVRSDQYFTYYLDYTRLSNIFNPVDNPDAEAIIREFLISKGFDSTYAVEPTSFPGMYIAMPLTPDGLSIRYDYFSAAGLTFRFDTSGLYAVEGNLIHYAPLNDQKYRVISAEEAFHKMLDPTASTGFLSAQASTYQPMQNWVRPRAENQTITVWGWMSSFPSAEGGAPLVSLDGFNAIGNLASFPESAPNTFVEATGQFQTLDGAKVFNVESWKAYEGYEDGIFGNLQTDGQNTVIVTDSDAFILPDVPAEIPLPAENMYATGVRQGNVFEWKTLDNRPMSGGGGGGGGSSGFYKINITGTPVPLPTPIPVETQPSSEPFAQQLEAQRGILSINIFERSDGSQRVQYGFIAMSPIEGTDIFNYYYLLEGDGLEGLQKYNGRPVDIWGTSTLNGDGIPVVAVERFEIPFPDLQFQILKGTEQVIALEGQNVVLFTGEDGNAYIELSQNCYDALGPDAIIGGSREGSAIQIEALPVPDLSFGGRPAVCIFGTAPANNPVTGEPLEMTVYSDQINVMPEPPSLEAGNLPTLSIEKVELVYFVPGQRYLPASANADPVYIQPAWRFFGHYSDGSIFEDLIQALDPIFLLPEMENSSAPG